MEKIITVGLGEYALSQDPQDILVAYGLGSCVGISMYDQRLCLAGLLHALLPIHPVGSNDSYARYVDTGINVLIDEMIKKGADRFRLVVRMAGGANMLTAPGFTGSFNIGTRNVEAAFTTLNDLKMKISGKEVGGTSGRTVKFYVKDGRMTIRSIGNQEREV
ncbi:MAG: chemotaxis protein CheD [Anaerolineales bacterium]|nr:chemotaxis protein CheD [Anaerolineales bacterium]